MDTIESLLKESIFVVEAQGEEHQTLWERWASNSPDRPSYIPVGHTWEQMRSWWITIGELDNRPVVVSFTFNKIDGEVVCFWEATSEVVDHKMIDEWFDEHYDGTWDNGTRRATTNAMNFLHCLIAIREKHA